MRYKADPRVDEYIDALPEWQQQICREVREIIFTGCATTGQIQGERPDGPLPATTRPVYNLAGYSPAFKDGYIDGCETAKKTRYGFKD